MTHHIQPEPELLLNGEPYKGDQECAPKPKAWKRRVLIGILLIETCFALPKLADGQLLSVFDAIFSSIQNDIGSSLNEINQVAQQMQRLWRRSTRLAALSRTRLIPIVSR